LYLAIIYHHSFAIAKATEIHSRCYFCSRSAVSRHLACIVNNPLLTSSRTIAAAALRLPSLLRASKSYDLTWELYDAAIWTQVEAAVGITCASVPALKPLVARYAPKILNSFPTRAKSEAGYSEMGNGLGHSRKHGSIKKTTDFEMYYSTASSATKSRIEEETV
jgi:hypothetical protein